MTHDLWEELNSTVYGFLSGVKLSHLVETPAHQARVAGARPRQARDTQPVSA